MLWRKCWLETRWRFWIGLILTSGLCVVVILSQPLVMKTLPTLQQPEGRLGEMIRQSMSLVQSYPGYIWSQWFGKNLLQIWTVLAILLGTGGLVTESSRGWALFTLSLPVSRRRLLAVRAAVGAAELAVLALAPSLLIPLLSPLIGESYSVVTAVGYSLLLVASGLVFHSFSFLLSSFWSDQLKPIVVGLASAFLLGVLPLLSKKLARANIFAVMSGSGIFASGALPWKGLLVSLAFAAVFLILAFRMVERRDF